MMRPLSALVALVAILLGAPPDDDDAAPAREPAAAGTTDPGATTAATSSSDAPATPARPAAPVPAANSDSILRGPQASEAPAPETLVARDFNGRVVVLEGEPEIAALRRILRDAATLEELERIVARRMAAFDELVRTHVPELQQGAAALQGLESAKDAASRLAALGVFAHAWQRFAPWRARGSAIDELADRLDDASSRKARRLVFDYRSALAQERGADLGLPARHPQVQAAVRLEAFARLVQESFERQTRRGSQDFDALVEALELTPDQAARAQAIFGALVEKEILRDARGWDRFRAISEFMRELTPRQRVLAWKYFRRSGG